MTPQTNIMRLLIPVCASLIYLLCGIYLLLSYLEKRETETLLLSVGLLYLSAVYAKEFYTAMKIDLSDTENRIYIVSILIGIAVIVMVLVWF